MAVLENLYYTESHEWVRVDEKIAFIGISDFAKIAMSWAVDHGLITGDTADTLSPKQEATRALSADFFMKFVTIIKK